MIGELNALFWKPKIDVIGRTKFWYQEKYGIPLNVWEEKTFPGKAPVLGGGTVTRSFFIRPGVEAEDVLVEVTETYLVPNEAHMLGLDEEEKINLFSEQGYICHGGITKLLELADIVVDCSPGKMGKMNLEKYKGAGIKHIFQGGEKI